MSSRRADALTVGALIECLRMFPAELPVVALYACRTAEGSVVKVEVGPGDGARESVLLIVD